MTNETHSQHQFLSSIIGADPNTLGSTQFYTKCAIGTSVFSLIINTGSCANVASQVLVEKLKLVTTPHPEPYHLRWQNTEEMLQVTEQVQITFKIGSYVDSIKFDVVPMHAAHLLLGQPWQIERMVSHDECSNQFVFQYCGMKLRMVPLAPEQARELPKIPVRLAPPTTLLVSSKQINQIMKSEEVVLPLATREEKEHNQKRDDIPAEIQQTLDRAIVPRRPTHPVVPKQLRQHLVQRDDWPRYFFLLKEFPQLGNSKLTIQIGESVRVLHYLNEGTNNFEFLAEIQVLPTLGTNNSSVIVNNTQGIRREEPILFLAPREEEGKSQSEEDLPVKSQQVLKECQSTLTDELPSELPLIQGIIINFVPEENSNRTWPFDMEAVADYRTNQYSNKNEECPFRLIPLTPKPIREPCQSIHRSTPFTTLFFISKEVNRTWKVKNFFFNTELFCRLIRLCRRFFKDRGRKRISYNPRAWVWDHFRHGNAPF